MALTTAMEDVMYDRKDFNYDPKHGRHPTYITEKHFLYHLVRGKNDSLTCIRASNGHPIVSPRRLRDIAIHRLVSDPDLLKRNPTWRLLPGNAYPVMLTEAILLREVQSIVWILSRWPMRVLRVHEVIPLEDCLESDYLTQPFEYSQNSFETSFVDSFVLGLLKLKPESNLKFVDFSGFDKDRKLCRELSRLPILWMKPEDRSIDKIADIVSEVIDVDKGKVQSFLDTISVVYSNVDSDYYHGNKIDTVTIFMDLKLHDDEIPLGLALQHKTPFRFSCSRLWMKPMREASLDPTLLGSVLDIHRITHFEVEDPLLPYDQIRFNSLLLAIANLRNLFGLSLPNSLDLTVDAQMAPKLNDVLRRLRFLQRLNLEYCNLRNGLQDVLDGLTQRVNYINLKDCRLQGPDILFLANWKGVAKLRELHLSCNNLELLSDVVSRLLERMPVVTCLAFAHCALSQHALVLLARGCKECSCLRTLCLQGYTPLMEADSLELLHVCSQIPTLQKALLFPEPYAFPGQNEVEREWNRYHTLKVSYRYLAMRKREDLELE